MNKYTDCFSRQIHIAWRDLTYSLKEPQNLEYYNVNMIQRIKSLKYQSSNICQRMMNK